MPEKPDPFRLLEAKQKAQKEKKVPSSAKGTDASGPQPAVPACGSPPRAPEKLPDTGLSESFLCDLTLKHIYFGGALEGIEVAERMCLDFTIVSEAIEILKKQELIMTQGGSGAFLGAKISYVLTERGRTKISEVLARDNYRGPAPVPFDQYIQQMKLQEIRGHKVSPDAVKKAFSHLILDPSIVDRIGPAINSGRSIFLYGPPGNGKTSLAECIIDTMGDSVFIPHSLLIESEIVRVFDETYHKRMEPANFEYDRRWVYSRRPAVIVGGELSLDMLDLTISAQTTYYEAPFQVKANGGVLVIDDFGRQRCNPQELFNRWIVPLESHVDFLTFSSGQKAEFPFDCLLVFSTNLDPKDLVDEAFLRRIRYKIEVGDPTEEEFRQIFKLICEKNQVPYDEAAIDYLIQHHYVPQKRPFRACHPRDLIEQMVDICTYTGTMPQLTPNIIDRLCGLYFVEL